MILSLSNVSKSYGTDVILEKISFNIEEKEKAAIVGVNRRRFKTDGTGNEPYERSRT